MRVPRSRGGPVCEFDRTVTPMVDVLFQLLVFFVLASGGRVAERSLSTVLAAGSVSSPAALPTARRQAELWIHLRHDAAAKRTTAALHGRKLADVSGLAPALRELSRSQPETVVILDAAGDVPLGDVIVVYDACRAARFHSIDFAASPDELGHSGS